MCKNIIDELEKLGYKARFVSAVHAKELVDEIEKRNKDKQLYTKVYENYLKFNADEIEDTGSLLICAIKLPIINLTFNWNQKEFPVIVPTGYIGSDIVSRFNDQLQALFSEYNYKLQKCKLPLKLLACRSGLARYGRNNVTYVEGFGSFYMLSCFYTDVPCDEDSFGEACLADECTDCSICLSSCPTGALSRERFMVNTDRCITYQNEIEGEFEAWVDPSWHNALIGCLKCQGKCPMNRPYLSDIRTYPAFTEEETIDFYNAKPVETLSPVTREKLEAIEFLDGYAVFTRNLKVLLDKC